MNRMTGLTPAHFVLGVDPGPDNVSCFPRSSLRVIMVIRWVGSFVVFLRMGENSNYEKKSWLRRHKKLQQYSFFYLRVTKSLLHRSRRL